MRIFLASILFLASSTVFAHGDKPSFEREVNGYLIDIGYNRVGIRPNEEVTFEFDLLTNSGAMAFADFSTVDIEIAKDGATTTTYTLANQKNFIPSWKHTFTENGTYQMNVDYTFEAQTRAATTFDVHVSETDGWLGRAMNIGTMIAAPLLVLFAAYVAIQSFRKKA